MFGVFLSCAPNIEIISNLAKMDSTCSFDLLVPENKFYVLNGEIRGMEISNFGFQSI